MPIPNPLPRPEPPPPPKPTKAWFTTAIGVLVMAAAVGTWVGAVMAR